MSLQDSHTTTADGPSLEYNEYFDLLSNRRRRYTLHYLKANGGSADLSELAEQLAAWENGIEPERVTYDQRKRVYTSLQQVHLSQMDDWGVIAFDDREGVAALTATAEDLDIYFEVVTGRDIPWSGFYLLLVLINSGVLALGASGVGPLGTVPDIGWAVFILTSFLTVSVVHLYLTRTEMRLDERERPPEIES